MAAKSRQQCRLNILSAASELMEEHGYLDLTIEEVAQRAGAGKQTIYRNWGNKRRLALDAFAHKASKMVAPDTGSLAGDIERYLCDLMASMSAPGKRELLAGLLAEAASDAEFGNAFRDTVIGTKRRLVRTMFQRGLARGEVDPETDIEGLIDLVDGPLWYRLMISGRPLDSAFCADLGKMVLRAAAPPRATSQRAAG